MNRQSSRTRAPASLTLADSLDEEHKELAAEALERQRTNSPIATRNATPPPSGRLLSAAFPAMRHGSIAGIGVGVTSPTTSTRRTIDPADPSTWTSTSSRRTIDPSDPSTWTSPHVVKPSQPVSERHRSGSDSAASGYVGMSGVARQRTPIYEEDPRSGLSNPTQGEFSHARHGSGGAMAAAISGDFSTLQLSNVPGSSRLTKHNASIPNTAQTVPAPSNVRHPSISSASLLSPIYGSATPPDVTTEPLRHRPKSDSLSSAGTDRLPPEGLASERALKETDEEGLSQSEADLAGSSARGRQRSRREGLGTYTFGSEGGETSPEMGRADTESQIAEIEQAQRDAVGPTSPEPQIAVISPTGETITPSTEPRVKAASSRGSDEEDEEDADIRKAKSLALNISALDTKVPDRHVQIILRGDFHSVMNEVTAGTRRARTYLACTDLSLESLYALEWTVGTMMRDGDTLLAIYAIEDESAAKATESEQERQQEVGHQVARDANNALDDLTRQISAEGPSISVPNAYTPATELPSLTDSIDARKVSKKELERLKAIEQIMQAFLKLVRKTTLQVRCMIEVIHCKSPKHLILGAIDELEPNLTVVGTRGRNSLKGVLLGSFSNYLVTKSSVPVMVARKKLKPQKKRLNASRVRLTNNLAANNQPRGRRSLTHARID